jgi:hypothetical protein
MIHELKCQKKRKKKENHNLISWDQEYHVIAEQKLCASVCNPRFPCLSNIDYNQIQIHTHQNLSSSKDTILNGRCLVEIQVTEGGASYCTTNYDTVRPRFAHSRSQQGKGSLPTSPARIKGTTKKT